MSEKGKVTLSGKVLEVNKSPKGFIVAVLCGATVMKFFTDDPMEYPVDKPITNLVMSGPSDGWMGFVKA